MPKEAVVGFVDLQKTRMEAGFVGQLLKRFGLPSDLGAAIAALAKTTIRDHQHLERLLTETAPSERQDLYDSIVPHLRFKPKPLDVYVASVASKAEREQWPVIEPDGSLREFRPATDAGSVRKTAEQAIAADLAERTLTLTCSKCNRQENFYRIGAETNVDTIKKARKIGWVYDPIHFCEVCPTCPTSLRPNA